MAASFVSGPVRVRAPATSANLGPGFDTLGLALQLHDDVAAQVTGDGYRVTVTGEGAGELPADERHLVVQAMLATFDELGGRPAGLALECVNRIPQARGLGSSSAAIVAGVLLARALVVGGPRRLDDAGALRVAARLEGHPDNVAPCLLGGFTIAWTEEGEAGSREREERSEAESRSRERRAGTCEREERSEAESRSRERRAGTARAVRLAPAEGVAPVVFVPAERGLTAQARAALPASVPHADAALTAGRAALLVHALTTAPDLLFPATEDRLHQTYRAAGSPATAALVQRLRAAGVAAVVSGAGPSVLALSPVPDDLDVGAGWVARALPIDVTGAVVRGGTLGHAERDPVAAGRTS